MQTLTFTVDAELLRELGERLVGKPYVALAELIKNGYDADATEVTVRVRKDSIEVADNGHGMRFDEFKDYWMRVGSTHKVRQQRSPYCDRPLTGSKGVGRLASQFLANELELRSVPATEADYERSGPPAPEDSEAVSGDQGSEGPKPEDELLALVDWESAVKAGELTSAEVAWELGTRVTTFPRGDTHGTRVTMNGLKHDWTREDFENLAREVWFLVPPFRGPPTTRPGAGEWPFHVTLESDDPDVDRAFDTQMGRVLDLFVARLTGSLVRTDSAGGTVRLSLELEDGSRDRTEYVVGPPCHLHDLEFEIRVFDLRHRQPHGITVGVAREYLNQFGGVHVYDTGFRVPLGGPDQDWLRIEFDHAHRLSASQLLPTDLQVSEGMSNLPTNSRLWGVVNVDTGNEARRALAEAPEAPLSYLQISVSRNRLVENTAFEQLRDAIRWALDYYAMRTTTLRLQARATREYTPPPAKAVIGIRAAVERHADAIAPPVLRSLRREVDGALKAVREDEERTRRQIGSLSAFATAGVTVTAFDHEFGKQLNLLEGLADRVEAVAPRAGGARAELELIAVQTREWLEHARATRRLFSHLADPEYEGERVRHTVRGLLDGVVLSARPLLRGASVDSTGADGSLRLPWGTYAEWAALFQNVLLNAANAMAGSAVRTIGIRTRETDGRVTLRIEDTGSGIDLRRAEEYFQPGKRGTSISRADRARDYGGSGLGLAIVRLIASQLGCSARFVRPSTGFSTCFELSWEADRD